MAAPRNVQEESFPCIDIRTSSVETPDSSCDNCDCILKKDDAPGTPIISVEKSSNESDSAGFHEQVNGNEPAPELQILPQGCNGIGTERPINESSQQSWKRDRSPSTQHDELAGKQNEQGSTDTSNRLNTVQPIEPAQPAQNLTPCNPELVRATNTSPLPVDTVDDPGEDLLNRRRKPKKLLRRVPVTSGGQSEKVTMNDSQVKVSTLSNSPAGASGATQAQAQTGKSGHFRSRRRRRPSNHQTLNSSNEATASRGDGTTGGIDMDTRAGTGTRPAAGGGAVAGTGTAPGAQWEVGASRAESDPAWPGPSRKLP